MVFPSFVSLHFHNESNPLCIALNSQLHAVLVNHSAMQTSISFTYTIIAIKSQWQSLVTHPTPFNRVYLYTHTHKAALTLPHNLVCGPGSPYQPLCAPPLFPSPASAPKLPSGTPARHQRRKTRRGRGKRAGLGKLMGNYLRTV